MTDNKPQPPDNQPQHNQPPDPNVPSQFNPLARLNRLPQPLQVEISGLPSQPNPPNPPPAPQPFQVEVLGLPPQPNSPPAPQPFQVEVLGLPSQPNSPSQPFQIEIQKSKKTDRDWWTVLIIPLILAFLAGTFVTVLTFKLSNDQHQHDMNLAATQQALDKAASNDLQLETQLKSYLDNMSALLTNTVLRQDNQAGRDLRSIARGQTLTVLKELGSNGTRKGYVLDFLRDAGLINRTPPVVTPPDVKQAAPIVSLANADLSGAILPQKDMLGGADLAVANLTGAKLNNADLSGADLDQAILKGADLTGANLNFTQLTSTDLTCLDPKIPNPCTNLSNADLSGADFADAKLTGAIFSNTDVTGTNFPDGFKKGLSKKEAFTTQWKVFQQGNILKIHHNDDSLLPPYALLDLSSSQLQLVNGPSESFGTSVVLLPALWSKASCPGDYCQGAPITNQPITPGDLSNETLPISVSGTIAGLTVSLTVSFSVVSATNTLSVTVDASISPLPPSVVLDQQGGGNKLKSEAFKPIILQANYVTPGQWSAQQAAFGQQPPVSFPNNNRTRPVNVSTFQLIGGKYQSLIDPTIFVTYPTISVTLNSLSAGGTDLTPAAGVVLQEQPTTSANANNVSMWLGIDSASAVPDAWNYTVEVSAP